MARKNKNEKPGLKFEKIVGKTFRQFAENSVAVTENADLPGRAGEPRQIDVLIQTSVAGLTEPLTVIAECKDYGRPVEVGKVDELIGKMADTGAVRGILVSNSGFTEGARLRATHAQGVSLSGVFDWQEPSVRWAAFAPCFWILHEVAQPIETLFDIRLKNAANEPDEVVPDLFEEATKRISPEALKHFEYLARDEWFEKGREMPAGETQFNYVLCDDDKLRIDLHCTFRKTSRYYYKKSERLLATGFYDALQQKPITNAAEMSPPFDINYIRSTYQEVDSEFDAQGAVTHDVTIGIGRDDRVKNEKPLQIIKEVEVLLPVSTKDGMDVMEPITVRLWDTDQPAVS